MTGDINETGKIGLKITAHPEHLLFSERNNFIISLTVTNLSGQLMRPELYLTKLFINEVESFVWSLAIGNGKKEAQWYSLPPGETTSMAWKSLGEPFFPVPGEYVLYAALHHKRSEEIRVFVNR
jgi:hypothetical protein